MALLNLCVKFKFFFGQKTSFEVPYTKINVCPVKICSKLSSVLLLSLLRIFMKQTLLEIICKKKEIKKSFFHSYITQLFSADFLAHENVKHSSKVAHNS